MEKPLSNETELIERARRFDRIALAQIYDLYSPGLYRYAMAKLGDTGQAEDSVAETFSRFLQALRAGKGPRDYIQAYLYRTAHNLIADHYRRSATRSETGLDEKMVNPDADPEKESQRRHDQHVLRAALAELTPDQQQVITLKFIQGWENDQIAAAVGKPVGAVKALQHRGMERLKRLLDKEKEEHEKEN